MRALRELRAAGGGPPRTGDSESRGSGAVHPEYARHGELSSLLYPEKISRPLESPLEHGRQQQQQRLLVGAPSEATGGRRPVLTPYAAAAITAARERRTAALCDDNGGGFAPAAADQPRRNRYVHPEYDPDASVAASLLYPERSSRPSTQQQKEPHPPFGRRRPHDDEQPAPHDGVPPSHPWERRANPHAGVPSAADARSLREKRLSRNHERRHRERDERRDLYPLAQAGGRPPSEPATSGPRHPEYVVDYDVDCDMMVAAPAAEPPCQPLRPPPSSLPKAAILTQTVLAAPSWSAEEEVLALRAQVAALANALHQGVVVPLPPQAFGEATVGGARGVLGGGADGASSLHVWCGPSGSEEQHLGVPQTPMTWQWKVVPLCH